MKNESEMDHKKPFSKCAIFPCSSSVAASVGKGKMKDDITNEVLTTDDDNAESINPPSLPKAPLKVVSAMKGSREKPPKKLIVKWAPDVYDPVASNSSRNKKKGSRESQGKEKKQRGWCLNSEQKEEVTFMNFHLDLDLYCGRRSCFAKSYGSSMHLSSIAEAA